MTVISYKYTIPNKQLSHNIILAETDFYVFLKVRDSKWASWQENLSSGFNQVTGKALSCLVSYRD